MKCPACGQWFDMRDLGQAAEHKADSPCKFSLSRDFHQGGV
jgi:hypothetical protein